MKRSVLSWLVAGVSACAMILGCGGDDGGVGGGSGGAVSATGGAAGSGAADGSGGSSLSPEEMVDIVPTMTDEELVNLVCMIQRTLNQTASCSADADAECETRYLAGLAGACATTERALAECKATHSQVTCAETLPYVYWPDCADAYDVHAACSAP